MADITTTDLNAALLDQTVAGTFPDQPYAFVPVLRDKVWGLGVAVANERGYNPIDGKKFETYSEAERWAKGLNKHIGLAIDDELGIIMSTMGGQRYGAPLKVR